MDHEDDDGFGLGDPMRPGVVPVAGEKKPGGGSAAEPSSPSAPEGGEGSGVVDEPAPETGTGGHREGEMAMGVPEPEIVSSRALTSREQEEVREFEEHRELERVESMARELTEKTSSFRVPRSLRRFAGLFLLVVASLIVLLLVGQVTSAIAGFEALPVWSRWVAGGLLILVGLVLVYVVVRLMVLYFRLRRNEQINLAGLQALGEREELRSCSQRISEQGVKQLVVFLREYPLKNPERLSDVGLGEEEIAHLVGARDLLLERSVDMDPRRWLEQFYADFQGVLDACANRNIVAYAKRVGFKTAISPMPLLDNAIVLTLSLAMVRDLMALYNLRGGKGASAQILIRAIAQAYLAGEFQDLNEALADSVFENIGDQVGQVIAGITKFVGSKVGEGLVNGIMVRRLGLATMLLLQPVSLGKK